MLITVLNFVPISALESWLVALGYDLSKVIVQPPQIMTSPEFGQASLVPLTTPALPVVSGLNCLANKVATDFSRPSAVVPSAVKYSQGLFERAINSRIASLPGVFGDGILLDRQPSGAVKVHILAEATPNLRDIISFVFNNTFMLDVHFNQHGVDLFYFAQPQLSKADHDWVQLTKLGTSLFNITRHPVVDSEGGRRQQIDIRVHSANVALNIKYGATEEEEKQRITNHFRR